MEGHRHFSQVLKAVYKKFKKSTRTDRTDRTDRTEERMSDIVEPKPKVPVLKKRPLLVDEKVKAKPSVTSTTATIFLLAKRKTAAGKEVLNFKFCSEGHWITGDVPKFTADFNSVLRAPRLREALKNKVQLIIGTERLSLMSEEKKAALKQEIFSKLPQWIEELTSKHLEKDSLPVLPDLPGSEVSELHRPRLKQVTFGYLMSGVASNETAHNKGRGIKEKQPGDEALSYKGHYLFDAKGRFFIGEEKKAELLAKIKATDPGFDLQERDLVRYKNFYTQAQKKIQQDQLRKAGRCQVSIAGSDKDDGYAPEHKRRILAAGPAGEPEMSKRPTASFSTPFTAEALKPSSHEKEPKGRASSAMGLI